jgi:MAGUK p55 subfamily protein 5
LQLNQQNPKGVTTTQDYSFLKDSSPIYVTSLSNNTVTSAATATAKITANPQQPVKSPTVKSVSNPLFDTSSTVGNHPELHQTNSTSNQLLTTSIIRKPITSSTVDNNKTIQNNINYIASASNPSLSTSLSAQTQIATPLTAIPLTDPSSDLIKHSAILHNNVNVLNNASSQLPNNLELEPIDSCTSYYSNNRTEVLIYFISLSHVRLFNFLNFT